jgi:N-methylhydantoinase B
VLQGKVSAEAAAADYGVVLGDPEATRRSRQELRDRRGEPAFFDRGPGYATLS